MRRDASIVASHRAKSLGRRGPDRASGHLKHSHTVTQRAGRYEFSQNETREANEVQDPATSTYSSDCIKDNDPAENTINIKRVVCGGVCS